MSDKLFMDTFPVKLDSTGRFSLPKKWRLQLADTPMVISQGVGECLAIRTMVEFNARAEDAIMHPESYDDPEAYLRMLGARSSEITLDGQGRVTIPPVLRDHAHLGSEILLTGVLNRIEVWDVGIWNAYTEAHRDEFTKKNSAASQSLRGN